MLPVGQIRKYNLQTSPLLTPSLGSFSVEDRNILCSIQPYLILGHFFCRSCHLPQVFCHDIERWHHQSKSSATQTPYSPNPLDPGPPYFPSPRLLLFVPGWFSRLSMGLLISALAPVVISGSWGQDLPQAPCSAGSLFEIPLLPLPLVLPLVPMGSFSLSKMNK